MGLTGLAALGILALIPILLVYGEIHYQLTRRKMKTIWKYPLKAGNVGSMFHLELPKGAKPILVGPDPEGEECIWVEFDRKNAELLIPRTFEIFGTGHLIPPLSTHVLSFKSGPFMWHLYDHGEVVLPIGRKRQ